MKDKEIQRIQGLIAASVEGGFEVWYNSNPSEKNFRQGAWHKLASIARGREGWIDIQCAYMTGCSNSSSVKSEHFCVYYPIAKAP